MRFFQQGDVLVKQVQAIPVGKQETIPTRILAEGEHTGHKHQIDIEESEIALADPDAEEVLSPSVRVLKVLDKMFVEAKREWTLRHEEHKPITMPPGVFEIGIVREADHMAGVVRRVAD
jgi:hypothetical protein